MAEITSFPNGGDQFKPIFTKETMMEVERKYASDPESGVNRRVLLASLTQGRNTMDKLAAEHPETLLEVFYCGVLYFAQQCQFMGMLQAACYRMLMVIKELPDDGLSKEDFEKFDKALGELMSHRVEVPETTD